MLEFKYGYDVKLKFDNKPANSLTMLVVSIENFHDYIACELTRKDVRQLYDYLGNQLETVK